MAAPFTASQIKLETPEAGENITEIQTYLETFNKEIESTDGTTTIATPAETDPDNEDADEEGEGTYFIDQSGNYYYQANENQGGGVMAVVSGVDGADEEEEYVINPDGDDDPIEGDEATIISGEPGSNQVLINSGDAYQTVTIVPSDTNQGEVSYVLIVQQDGDGKDEDNAEDQDMTVYDFDEAEENGLMDSEAEDDKSKIVKILPRKSQTVTQAHMCNYCNYTSPKRYLLSRHLKSHSEERPHKCSVCERGFKTLASLQNHVNTHTGLKPHHCKYCDSAFTTSGELVRHVRYRHTHEKPHKCHECDYASVELSKLKRHIRCHTGERPYQCPHCTYASPDTFKLKRHLRIHTGEKPYECDICQARFTQSNSLKAHKLTHNVGDKPIFQCELCPTTCGRKTDLRIHVQKLHTSDKPLKCKRCGKSFPDRYSYKIHNKSHEGEKCFKCEFCLYASISARHLESHMLIHTDQKPFQCDQCDQSFRQKQLLKRHQNLYHNPTYVPPPPREKTNKCPDCGRAFRHNGNLMRHMAVHDPESSTQQKQLALKIGRQKKIQIIDGQQVEVMPGVDSDAEDDSEMMSVEGSDGQQYVVLEVIQLGDEGDQTVAVMSENDEAILNDERMINGELNDEEVIKALQTSRRLAIKEDEKKDSENDDMTNCFGFDEEEDDDQDMDMKPGKHTITLLGDIDDDEDDDDDDEEEDE